MTNASTTSPTGFRIAQVGIGTESSTFAPHRTGDDDFTVTRGEEVHADSAYLHDHRLPDFPQVEFVPLMDARAMPGGPVLPETFGASRLMFGSDWPVCLLAAGYERWFEAAQALTDGLTGDERDAVFGGTAADFYGV